MDLDGILLIDKEKGITSFETVQKVKRLLKVNKAGHAGTLHKSASGLLIVCINRATAIQSLLMSKSKRYRATLLLGMETDTLDSYGRVIKREPVDGFSDEKIEQIFSSYLGNTKQVPPIFSAIHKDGKRLYRRALNGEDISVDSRDIEINELRLLKNERNSISFEVIASKGTYIRSLGRDIARSLGTCGHITDLRRLEIGTFSVERALKLKEIRENTGVISINDALEDLDFVNVDYERMIKISNGFPLEKIFFKEELETLNQGFYRVIFNNTLITIIEKKDSVRYFKVFKDMIK